MFYGGRDSYGSLWRWPWCHDQCFFGDVVELSRMLCRVVLGHVLRLASTDFKAHETIRGTEYTSVLGCADGSNQEFVVFDVTQVNGNKWEWHQMCGSWSWKLIVVGCWTLIILQIIKLYTIWSIILNMSHLADFLGSWKIPEPPFTHTCQGQGSAARSTPSISCSTLIQRVRLQIARCSSDGCGDRSECWLLTNRPNMRSDYRRNRSDFLVSGSHGKWRVNLGRRGHELCEGRSRGDNGEVRTAYDLQNFEDLHFVRTCWKSHLAQVAHWLQLAETRAPTNQVPRESMQSARNRTVCPQI